ncbi:MAG: glutaredoxin family protein [Gammaproteobacteria bacterium]|nr:glutaredoxin family protein [Gammaproteobacteria bacterium]
MSFKSLLYTAIVLVILVKSGVLSNPFASNQDYVEKYEGQVILYATTWCGYCKKVRQLMKKNRIPFTEYDIEKSPEGYAEFKELGGRGVPLMVIDGEVIRGYNPSAILEGANNL